VPKVFLRHHAQFKKKKRKSARVKADFSGVAPPRAEKTGKRNDPGHPARLREKDHQKVALNSVFPWYCMVVEFEGGGVGVTAWVP